MQMSIRASLKNAQKRKLSTRNPYPFYPSISLPSTAHNKRTKFSSSHSSREPRPLCQVSPSLRRSSDWVSFAASPQPAACDSRLDSVHEHHLHFCLRSQDSDLDSVSNLKPQIADLRLRLRLRLVLGAEVGLGLRKAAAFRRPVRTVSQNLGEMKSFDLS